MSQKEEFEIDVVVLENEANPKKSSYDNLEAEVTSTEQLITSLEAQL